MQTITKKTLVERIAGSRHERRGDIKRLLTDFLEQIAAELSKGNRIEFRNFGVFEVKERAARVAQNPKTLEQVKVPARRTVRFKAGRELRERMGGRGAPGRQASLNGQAVKVEIKPRRAGAGV